MTGDDLDKADNPHGFTSLHYASYFANPESVRMMLAAGASPNLKTIGGHTPLIFAPLGKESEDIQLDTVRQLIAAGSDVNAADLQGLTSLQMACLTKKLEIVKLLVCHGASLTHVDEVGRNALYFAVARENVQLVRWLISAGADINFVNEKKSSLSDTISGPSTALHVAIWKNNVDMLECLLDCGADPNAANSLGMSALYFAVTRKSAQHNSIIKLLLDAGADMYDGGVGQTKSPFEILVSQGRLPEVQLFLKSGLDLARYNPEAPENFSPLHKAITLNNGSKMLNLLLKHSQGSLSFEHEDKDRLTPLCRALQQNSLDCVRLLLKADANVNHIDSKGHTPLELVSSWSDFKFEPACIQLLVEAGAKVDRALQNLVSDSFDATETSNENGAKKRLELAKLIVKYKVLSDSLLSGTDPTEHEIMGVSDELRSFQEACEAEIVQLKEATLLEPITLYQVLAADEEFYKGVTDDVLFEVFDEECLRSRFPLYSEEICKSFKSVKDMHEIFNRAVSNLRYSRTSVSAVESFRKTTPNTESEKIDSTKTEISSSGSGITKLKNTCSWETESADIESADSEESCGWVTISMRPRIPKKFDQ